MEIDSKLIAKGINLYLKSVHNRIYQEDVGNLINCLGDNEQEIDDEIDESSKRLRNCENEINYVSKEKICLINRQQEILEQIDALNLQLYSKELGLKKDNNHNKNNESKRNKYLDLVKSYNNLTDKINKQSKDYNKFKSKNSQLVEDNKRLAKSIQEKINILAELDASNSHSKLNSFTNIKVVKTEVNDSYTERPTQTSNLPTDAGTNRTRVLDRKTKELFSKIIK